MRALRDLREYVGVKNLKNHIVPNMAQQTLVSKKVKTVFEIRKCILRIAAIFWK